MKHSLDVVDSKGAVQWAEPLFVRAADTVIEVADTGDGREASRFVALLQAAGAELLEGDGYARVATRLVVRSPALTSEELERAARSESTASVVLGSARPAFARHWVHSLLDLHGLG